MNPGNRSITATIVIALTLAGIIPLLMSIYIFTLPKAPLSHSISFFVAMTLICILSGYSLLRRSSDRLVELSRRTSEFVMNGRLEQSGLEGEKEIEEIAASFISVADSLSEAQKDVKEQSVQLIRYAADLTKSYQKIREETELRGMLSQYVGQNLVDDLIRSKGEVFSRNDRKEVTVLFADIRAFSTIAEKVKADKVVTMLNEFFSSMVGIIFRNNGILDKFVGDQIMAVFGIIEASGENPACDAINTAIEMQIATKALMKTWKRQGKEIFDIGIGINTGNAIVGNVGSENRKNYTVIGDSVNVAGRLQQLAEGGEIAVGEKTYLLSKDQFSFQESGDARVKNRTESVLWYKLNLEL